MYYRTLSDHLHIQFYFEFLSSLVMLYNFIFMSYLISPFIISTNALMWCWRIDIPTKNIGATYCMGRWIFGKWKSFIQENKDKKAIKLSRTKLTFLKEQKNFLKFTGKRLWQSLFFSKVTFKPVTLLNGDTTLVFSC